ncbi:MAG: hypothetical protein C4547_12690 [Phycisphaerales bacterium]|nr:MAG: hypothetical protein C4547_12690 [Phycisphaerales bacterium]
MVSLVLGGAGYVLAPSLQDSARTDYEAASRKVEAAQRLLYQYNANLARIEALTADLGPSVPDLAQASERARDEDFAGLYQDEVDTTVEVLEIDRSRRPTGAIESQIRDGVKARASLIADNDKLLADALAAVGEALRLSPSHAAANRVKGSILTFQGQAMARKSAGVRRRALAARDRVGSAVASIAADQPRTTLVSTSGIQEQIASMEAESAERQAASAQVKQTLADLDANIARLEGELAAAQAEADAARAVMDAMSRSGMDLSRPDGFVTFERDYSAAAAKYRSALGRVHAINHGTLPKATIDASGDYLRGAYVENGRTDNFTVAPGLAHYRAERDRVAGAVASATDAVTRYQERIGRLKDTLATYQQQQSAAAAGIREAQATGAAAVEDLIRDSDDARRLEDEAISRFSQAADAWRAAEVAADNAVRSAAEAARLVSPTAEDVSAASILKDDSWIGAHLSTERAGAKTAAAWVHFQQYQNETGLAEALASAANALGLGDDVAQPRRDLAEAARTAGVQAADSAIEAIQNVHGKLGKNWTVVAQYAGAVYLKVVFGERQYLKDVVANYRNAIAGRETTPAAATFKERLAKVEKMQ